MAKQDNTVLYTILGLVSGPIGGASFGYSYAKKKQLLYTLDPSAERGWDNSFINCVVGVLGTFIAGTMFGYNTAKLENRINALAEKQRESRERQVHSSSTSLEPERATSVEQWQDYINSQKHETQLSR